MKNKKVLALLISLVLIVAVALPGTLAVSSDQDAVNSDFTVDTASPAPETPEQPVDPENPEQPEQPETPEQPEQPVVPETQEITGEPQTPAEVPACTCDPAPTEGEAHKEGCPLAPLSCTCDPAPAEGEAHKEGCPLYVDPNAPIVINHIETCLEGCTGEECTCVCHLFERIMACETMEKMEAIIAETPEEELKALTEEQLADIEARMEALMPAPLPAIVIEESEPPVESEVYRPTVNYACVAPFGAPVTGGQG